MDSSIISPIVGVKPFKKSETIQVENREEFHANIDHNDGFFITETNEMSNDELHSKKASPTGKNPF